MGILNDTELKDLFEKDFIIRRHLLSTVLGTKKDFKYNAVYSDCISTLGFDEYVIKDAFEILKHVFQNILDNIAILLIKQSDELKNNTDTLNNLYSAFTEINVSADFGTLINALTIYKSLSHIPNNIVNTINNLIKVNTCIEYLEKDVYAMHQINCDSTVADLSQMYSTLDSKFVFDYEFHNILYTEIVIKDTIYVVIIEKERFNDGILNYEIGVVTK